MLNLDNPYDPNSTATATVRSVTADDYAALQAFVTQTVGSTSLLEQHWSRARYRSDFTIIVLHDGEIVGCALLGHIRLRIGAATLEAGIVDLFATTDQGDLATALIGAMLSVLRDADLPLALITGDPATFEPFGFAPFQLREHVQGWQVTPSSSTLRAITADDGDEVAAIYAQSYAALPLGEMRAAPDWRAWLAAHPHAQVQEDGRGRITAYAVVARGTITEAAAVDSGAAQALLSALANVVLALPLAHPVARAALWLGGVGTTTVSTTDSDPPRLAGVVDLPVLLEQLIPAFDERLSRSRYAQWSGNIQIELETERVTLAIDNGRATVIDGARPADVRLRRVKLPALTQLLLGQRDAAAARASGGLDCDDAALGLLDIIFPV